MTRLPARAFAATAAAVLGCAALLPACRSGASAVSSDPSQPIYRNPSVDLGQIKSIRIHFVSVTTSNNEGVDLTQSAFKGGLEFHLRPRFGDVAEGSVAAPNGALLDVTLVVNWGSRAGRYFSAGLGGRAGIEIRYELKDATGALLARMHATDRMSGAFSWYGGNAKELVINAASKWNRYFAETVLGSPPSTAP
jgi:hypothetical protein